MSAQFYSLKELKSRLERLIEDKGEDATVAYWIYTADDVLTYDDEGDEKYFSDEVSSEILVNLADYDHIHQAIVDAIDEEIKYLHRDVS